MKRSHSRPPLKPLTQADIDLFKPEDHRVWFTRILDWLDMVPGWGLTLILLGAFALGYYFMYLIWEMGSQIVATAGKG